MQAGIELGTPLAYALVIGGVVTSLLTLLAVARVWNRAFWRRPSDAEHPDPVLLADPADLEETGRGAQSGPAGLMLSTRTGATRHATLLPRTMVGSTLGLVVLGVALTVFAGPLFGLSDRAAQDMLDRSPYIQAVMGEDTVVPPSVTPAAGSAGGGQ